ncbi:MAG: hypothetical protein NC343_07400 [Muribaculum sp.]|nr:hypothetical protein [Muribaculum sp.]
MGYLKCDEQCTGNEIWVGECSVISRASAESTSADSQPEVCQYRSDVHFGRLRHTSQRSAEVASLLHHVSPHALAYLISNHFTTHGL